MKSRIAPKISHLLLTLTLFLPVSLVFGCDEEDTGDSPAVSDSATPMSVVDEPTAMNGDTSEATEETSSVRPEEAASGPLYLHQVQSAVERSIPTVLIGRIEVDGSTALVRLKQNSEVPVYAEYYEIADQRNRIIAIESVRWFRDLPGLARLILEIPSTQGPVRAILDRQEVADFYDLSIAALADDRTEKNWRENFLVQWDHEEKRRGFVEHFVR